MTLDSIDLTLWLAGIIMESVLLVLVVWKRIYRMLPVFFSFLIWCLCSDAGMAVAHLFPGAYLPATLANITVDALFQLAMLAELGRSVLLYNRAAPPSRLVIVLLTALACVLAGSLNKWTVPTQLPIIKMLYVVLMQLLAVLRVVFLLTLVWWSSLQGLRWPTRELRIVTGLGFYILATFCVAILHTHNMGGMQYHWLDQLLVGGYLWTLSYWILASTTKVAEPQ
ncbi:MAG TPA: hypothetical protein VGT08_10205 [Terracidiphilus sp.]|nr:hypothetical protein [Terracidiphilus sp.]